MPVQPVTRCVGVVAVVLLSLGSRLAADVNPRGAEAPPVPPTLVHEGALAGDIITGVPLKPALKFFSPALDEEWTEGNPVTIRWLTVGPIQTVRLFYYGDLTRLGGRERGSFSNLITDKIPNEGYFQWTVPWIDASGFVIRIAGFDAAGRTIAEAERGVNFRPKEAEGLRGTFIVVSKRRQRLWYYEDNRLRWISIVSTARAPYSTPDMRPGSGGRRGAMGRVFYKDPNAYSRMYNCPMRWWMAITSSGSHGIHATSPGFYPYLGGPASHGCIRQHRADAEKLYHMVSVGTAVYVD